MKMKKLKSTINDILLVLLFTLGIILYIPFILIYSILATLSFIFALPIWLLFGKKIFNTLTEGFNELLDCFSSIPDEVNDYLNNKVKHNE